MCNNIIRNTIIPNSAKVFRNVHCISSDIGERCCIGDDCDIENSILNDKCQLGRRNKIKNSTIGRGTYTGTNTIITCSDIGKYCSISWNVSIGGMNHDYKRVSLYTDYWHNRTFGANIGGKQETFETRTKIGNDVWIGAGANILGGVKIGDGCVIGSGCVVVDDLEPYCIVVGVPAKIIKYRFETDVIELLKQVKWWDWSEDEIINNIDFLREEPTVTRLKEIINRKREE